MSSILTPLLLQLKCLGDDKTSERKEGSSCNRCRTNGIKCVFPQPSTNKGSKRRRSTQAASRALKTNTSPTSSPATTAPMASSSLPSTGVTHKIARADFAHSTRQDTKPLSNTTIEQPTNLRSSEHAKQLNFAGTESIGGHDMHSDLMDTGNDPTHQFDFNLSMLYTADDSHGFGFLSGNSNEWSALPYGVHDSNVYSKLQARPFVDHKCMRMLIPPHRGLQHGRFSNGRFFNGTLWGLLQLNIFGDLGHGSAT